MGLITDGILPLTALFTEGRIEPQKPEMRTYSIQGAPGTGVILGPRKRAPSVFVSHSTAADQGQALFEQELMQTLVGVIVAVTDEYGTTWNNVLVLDCQVEPPRPCVAIAGGNAPGDLWEIVARWVFLAPVS